MTQVIVEEPETVTREVTKYKCKECKGHFDEDEINTVPYIRGHYIGATIPRSEVDEWRHYCDDCVGLRRALRIEKQYDERMDYIKEWWTGTKKAALIAAPAFVLGVAFTFMYLPFIMWGNSALMSGWTAAFIGILVSAFSGVMYAMLRYH